jgi:hypothetical protein
VDTGFSASNAAELTFMEYDGSHLKAHAKSGLRAAKIIDADAVRLNVEHSS